MNRLTTKMERKWNAEEEKKNHNNTWVWANFLLGTMEEDGKQRGTWRKSVLSWLPQVEFSPGVVLTILLSLVISIPTLLRVAKGEDLGARFDLETGLLGSVTVHRLITYIYFHEDVSSLVCSVLIIWYFGGGFEENMGTAKFCFLTPIFAVSSGLIYLAVLATGLNLQVDGRVQGFTTVAFAMLCVFTSRSSFRRMLFFGVMVPTKVLPLLFLLLALFIPHAPVLSNVCGILVGTAYGMGGRFFLDLPEPLMSRIDQSLPSRFLKRIPIWKYIPSSSVERNASQTRKINPPPGSYPTQQYYTPPQGLSGTYSPYHNMKPAGKWPPSGAPVNSSPYPVGDAPGTLHQTAHICTGGHSHSHTGTSTIAFGVPDPPADELLQVQTQ
ncbi:rhomboid domain-containing protein 2 [Rhinophrynus dorsalis]